MSEHKKTITAISWCPHNPDMFASASADNLIIIWNVAEQKVIARLDNTKVMCAATSSRSHSPLRICCNYFKAAIQPPDDFLYPSSPLQGFLLHSVGAGILEPVAAITMAICVPVPTQAAQDTRVAMGRDREQHPGRVV
eukprot:g39395.t1